MLATAPGLGWRAGPSAALALRGITALRLAPYSNEPKQQGGDDTVAEPQRRGSHRSRGTIPQPRDIRGVSAIGGEDGKDDEEEREVAEDGRRQSEMSMNPLARGRRHPLARRTLVR